MDKPAKQKLAAAVGLFSLAAAITLWNTHPAVGGSQGSYFYDLDARKLFAAPRSAIPPIRPPGGTAETAMRAVVVAPDGDSSHASDRRIAYLEKYAPDLKAQLEAVRAGKSESVPPREVRQNFIYVRRLDEETWHAISTPEGRRIMTEWQSPGPDGRVPVVCVP